MYVWMELRGTLINYKFFLNYFNHNIIFNFKIAEMLKNRAIKSKIGLPNAKCNLAITKYVYQSVVFSSLKSRIKSNHSITLINFKGDTGVSLSSK